ncbi:hypothetical protein D3C76_724530 [compost metagenome]
MSPTSSWRALTTPKPSSSRLTANTASAGPGWARAETRHHSGCRASAAGWLLARALRSRVMCEMMIGSISLLVTIISITPMQAVTPSSCTMGMSISMITAKPRAFISSARAPGMKILQKAERAAVTESLPSSTSCFQALVICTAWDTPMEKIRNGTRIDMGSMPRPSSGSRPSSQTTGSSATSSDTTVSLSERA